MLTDDDRKQLEKLTGEQGAKPQLMLVCAICFLLFMACVDIYIANQFATLSGHTFREFLTQYANGVSLDRQYSGVYIRAADRIGFVLLHLGLAFILALGWRRNAKERVRAMRIIVALKKSGGW